MTAPLWTSQEVAAATGGRALAPFAARGVCIDSRAAAPGDLFVALSDRRDGHDFVAAALAAGAAGALVSRMPPGVAADAPLVLVEDTMRALTALGAAARARSQARVAAVTGSAGKTSVKEMLRAMLAPQGPTHAAEKSFNNHWGVPLTLARMPRETRFAVIEIGMNHPGEIGPLSRLARPHAAIVTTVAKAHLAAFDSEAGIARAKAEIFEGLEPGGAAILNRDNPHFALLARRARRRGARILRFGAAQRCHARLIGAEDGPGGCAVQARLMGRPALFRVGAPGRHMAMNALAALLAAQALGADPGRAALELAAWTPPEGRGMRWRVALDETGLDGAIHLIDESYNANPASMSASLAVLAAARPEDGIGRVPRGRRIAVLGDMLELGEEERALHAAIADDPAMQAIDRVHCVGPRMKALHEALPRARRGEWTEDSAAMAAMMRRLLDAGDVVMVKGSLGARMARVVEAVMKLGRPEPARADQEAL
ncbi:UDP-N-acetylmuramoyl-tripeptide--D-alanyl-D-alanine ligase [Oceanicella actignis]|uniref:UDP-N-acetylmuramoyl-tripeptide--D-alanyl-D-alanine ligase n=1 Tax=Oceanicella actignis TaxID=1189325 RepID=A0A1M7SBT5_9RHOB|nr:UDP-N-acetylmuramoyl-tripeptide--D-alanyl-D-alanine ligase [Oceanicella actignis]SET28295.1 UDP-N-acetylmuramoyl-tripeptide--D-alanyl-D-alanine ligase [Oceanicella actignis]SHN55702.1 UDP-N-acetylmuramoyl-tripeptide--D-alanyl-D-alanine ligase [Oceanicella actignis]